MLQPEQIERVYLHRAPVDMRKQRNGLAALVHTVIAADEVRERINGALVTRLEQERRDLEIS